ncbi:hypothetical protein KVR01_013526 [Diaporthe batatas]|uniref:uncharacterized protein n=1 Tax=Diaporthe batatas TaxID=748121 RepID=UPI001D04405D|nr:uncharacterized protein KVR01_013526 [Diaporthe batatas]KAG8156575.1 hypothetical protein KVR01_013526 [Diaporthe batatas]
MAGASRDERTPLLNGSTNGHQNGTTTANGPIGNGNGIGNGTVGEYDAAEAKTKGSWATRIFGPPNTIKVLLAGFIITFAFSFTQVPIFYVFHLMECDVYYETHPPHTGPGDRCSVNEIAAGTATQFSILGMSTTFCGTVNLFITGWSIKKWGPRAALVQQTFIPAIRVATQVIGVLAGGNAGITIIQTTQLITIFGGPAGYILVVNTIAGELVEPMQRTAVFGQLQACIMLGQAISYLLGGMVGDVFGIRMPFQVAFVLFLCATLYSRTVLPYIDPASLSDGKKTKAKGVKGFLAPLKILAPQRIRFMDGRVANHFGVFFLCCGIFLAVLATSYGPLLIQMYATAYFDFTQADNGWLMSGNALCRSIFLFFAFPKIIDAGRKWWVRKVEGPRNAPPPAKDPNALSRIPSRPEQLEAPMWSGNQNLQEESMPEPETRLDQDRTASQFDLFFLRWSLLLDGLMTGAAALCTERWHIFLASFLLPLGSGSAPAAKGVITEMCSHGDRTDALNAVTLVENIARLATQGLFGFIFSALAETGKAYMTFHVNAALAIVGMAVLYLSHFPPANATILEENEGGDQDDSADVDTPNLARVTSHETDR